MALNWKTASLYFICKLIPILILPHRTILLPREHSLESQKLFRFEFIQHLNVIKYKTAGLANKCILHHKEKVKDGLFWSCVFK